MNEIRIDQGTVLYLPKWIDPKNGFILQIHDQIDTKWSVSVFLNEKKVDGILSNKEIRLLINKLNLTYHSNKEV